MSPEDYWWEQRYAAMYYVIHGHQPGEPPDRTERDRLISHLGAVHGLVGYDPFPIGTEHHFRADVHGNVREPNPGNDDLGYLRGLHEEARHGSCRNS